MRLPLLPDADTEGALNFLQLGTLFAAVNEAPHMTSSRRKNGESEELQKFVKLSQRLRSHIKMMHKEAINVLSPKSSRHVFAVEWELEAMVDRAEARLASGAEVAASTSPKRLEPEQVAQICAQLYTDLTGKRPAPHGNEYSGKKGGPYLRFLSDVYSALGINANAEHYGRHAEGVEVIGGNGGATMRKVSPKEG
jgi:hypothetical protein